MKQIRVWRLGKYGDKVDDKKIEKFAKSLKAAYESVNSDIIWDDAIDCLSIMVDPSDRDVIIYNDEDENLEVLDVDMKQKKMGF